MNFEEINKKIAPLDIGAMNRSIDRWNAAYKPIDGLGELEHIITDIAGLTGSDTVKLEKRVAVPMCADNGVVEEGISQSDQSITAVVAGNMGRGIANVCVMGRLANVKVLPINVGINSEVMLDGVRDCHVMRGTKNMAKEPAMTREQAIQAIMTGMNIAQELKESDIDILVSGEMGIGNTSTTSALASVLLGLPVEAVTGTGAGLPIQALDKKIEVIKKSILVNNPDPDDPLDVLSKVGGLDIAAMTGLFIGGAMYRLPVLIDGVISMVAALVAARLCPMSRVAMIATHMSHEPAAIAIAKELKLKPIIDAGLRLGEGTGALCLLPMLDMALAVYNGETFQTQGQTEYIDYKVFEG